MNGFSPKAQAVVNHVDSISQIELIPLSNVSFEQFLLDHKRYPIVAITGQSGVGKTTFTNLFIEHLKKALVQESQRMIPPTIQKLVELPQMSPYLAAIKASSNGLGQEVWEKNQELFRVLDESIVTNAMFQAKNSIVVMDFSIVQVLVFAYLKIHGKAGKKFTGEFNTMFKRLPKPDFIVKIQADSDRVLSRIESRGTYIDQQLETVTRELSSYYNTKGRDIIGEYYRNTPIISIDTTNIDLREDTAAQSDATRQAVNDVIARIAA